MRWRFYEHALEAEAQARAKALAAIDRWWAAFAAAADAIDATFRGGGGVDVAAFMEQHLSPIDPRLMWEYGPGLRNGGHRLVITPESQRQLRPLVEAMLDRAPSLPRWEFYPGRLAESVSRALSTVRTRSRTGLDLSPFEVEAAPAKLNQIDLTWFLPPGMQVSDAAHEAVFVASELLLGEEVLDTWVGVLEVQARPASGFFQTMLGRGVSSPTGDRALGSLAARAGALIGELQRALPSEPFATQDGPGGSVFKLEPRNQSDYAGQEDLFVGVSHGSPDLWQACHAPAPFSSRRFSRLGETFCYLKIDGVGGLAGSAFEDRHGIEEALDHALSPTLGGVTGGGTGLRYSYVDLALLHLDAGLAAARACLQAGRLPKRSWILFHDAQWRDEWVGIYEETPPPFSGAGTDA